MPLLLLLSVLLCTLIPLAHAKDNVSKVRTAAENAFASGDIKKAVTLFSKLIELEPRNERNYYKRFRAYLSERKYAHALNDLSSALEINPKYKQGMLQRGKLHMMLGECSDAIKDFQALVQLYPNDASAKEQLEKSSTCSAYLNQAEYAQSRGDYQSAHTYLTHVLEEAAVSSVSLLLERAQLSRSLQNPYDAIADLGSILKLDPSNLAALQMRGEVLYSLGDRQSLDAALSHFRQGLHSDPENKGLKQLYRQLKKVLKFMGNAENAMDRDSFDEAVEELEAALAVDPSHRAMNKELWFKLCQCELKRKQYAKAQEACEQVIQVEQSHAAAHAKLSEAHLGQEHFEEAVRLARRAVELDDGNREYQNQLHRAETALKQSKNKNYYKILGVARDASLREIKKAYRKQALEWHPDKHSDKEESLREEIQKKFHDITEAYEILSDEEMRARYDRGEDVTGNGQQQQQQYRHPFQRNPFGNAHFFQQGGRTFHFNFG